MIERYKFTHNLDQIGTLPQHIQMNDESKTQEDYNSAQDRFEEKPNTIQEEKTVSRRGLRDSVMKQQMLVGNNQCGKSNQMLQELKVVQQDIKFKRQMTSENNSLNNSQSPIKSMEDYLNNQNSESCKKALFTNEDPMLSSGRIAKMPFTQIIDKQQSQNETINFTADYTTITSEGYQNSTYDGSALNINNPVNLGILSSGSNTQGFNMNQLQNNVNNIDCSPKVEPFNQDNHSTPSNQMQHTRSKNLSFMHKQIKEVLEQEGYIVEESAGLKQLEQLHIIESQRQLVQQASQIYDSSREGSMNQIDDDIQEKDSKISKRKSMRLSLGKELLETANKKDIESKNCGNSSPYKNTGSNRQQSEDKNSYLKRITSINGCNENKDSTQPRRYSVNFNEDESSNDNKSLLRKNVFLTNAVSKTPINSNQFGVTNWQQINVDSNEDKDLLSFHDISERQMQINQKIENEDADDETSQIEKFFKQQKANCIEKIDLKKQDSSSSSLSGSEVEQRISNFENYSSKPTCGGGESTRNRSMRMNIGWGGAMKNKNSCEGDDEEDYQSEKQSSNKNSKKLLNKFKTFSKNGTVEYDSEDMEGQNNVQKINLNFYYDNQWNRNGNQDDDEDDERSDEYRGTQTARHDNKVFNKFQKYYAQNTFQFDSIEEMESSQESIKKSSTKNSMKAKYPGTTRSLPKTDNPSSFLQYIHHRKSRRQKSNMEFSDENQQDYEKNDNFSQYLDGVNQSIDITVNLDQSQNLKSSLCKSSQSSAKKQPQSSSSSFHFNLNQVKMDILPSPPLSGQLNQENPENNLSNNDSEIRKINEFEPSNQDVNDQQDNQLITNDQLNMNISNQSNQDSENTQNNQIQLMSILNNIDQQNLEEIYTKQAIENKFQVSKFDETESNKQQSTTNEIKFQQNFDKPNLLINLQQPQLVDNNNTILNTPIFPIISEKSIKNEPTLSLNSVYFPQNQSHYLTNTTNISNVNMNFENNNDQLLKNIYNSPINSLNNQNSQNNIVNMTTNKGGLNKQNLQVHTVNLQLTGNDVKLQHSPRQYMISPTSLGNNLSLQSNLNQLQNSSAKGISYLSQNQVLSPISSLTNLGEGYQTNAINNPSLYQNLNQQLNVKVTNQNLLSQENNNKLNSISQKNYNNSFLQNYTPKTVTNHNSIQMDENLYNRSISNPNFMTFTANINLITNSLPKSTAPSLTHVPQIDSPRIKGSYNSRMDDMLTPHNMNDKRQNDQLPNQKDTKSNVDQLFTTINDQNSPLINTNSYIQMSSPTKKQIITNQQITDSNYHLNANPQSFQSTHEVYSPLGINSYSPLSSQQTTSIQNSNQKQYPQNDLVYEEQIKRSALNLNNNSFISQYSPHKINPVLGNTQISTPISSSIGYQTFSGTGNNKSMITGIGGNQYEQISPYNDIQKNQQDSSSIKPSSVQNINLGSIPLYSYSSEQKIQFDSKSPSTTLSQPQIPNFYSSISPFNSNSPANINIMSNNTQPESELDKQKQLESILSVYRNRIQSLATPTVKIDLQKNTNNIPYSPHNISIQDSIGSSIQPSSLSHNTFQISQATNLQNSLQNTYLSSSQNPSLTNFSQNYNLNNPNIYPDTKNLVNYPNQGSYLMSPLASYQNLQTSFNLSKPSSYHDLGLQDGQEKVVGYILPGNKGSYTGNMRDNKKNGQGTIIYPDGSTYTGNFYNDLKNGFGQEFDKNKQIIYQGEYLDDKYNGTGILYNNKSQIIQKNIEHENLSQIQNAWTQYNGQFFQGIKQGKGKMTFVNHDVYDGYFSEDKPYGLGEFTFSNGKTVKGIWDNGILKKQ